MTVRDTACLKDLCTHSARLLVLVGKIPTSVWMPALSMREMSLASQKLLENWHSFWYYGFLSSYFFLSKTTFSQRTDERMSKLNFNCFFFLRWEGPIKLHISPHLTFRVEAIHTTSEWPGFWENLHPHSHQLTLSQPSSWRGDHAVRDPLGLTVKRVKSKTTGVQKRVSMPCKGQSLKVLIYNFLIASLPHIYRPMHNPQNTRIH